ncbi:MAG: methionine synthase [Clostridiales bacterium]|nr:methionine synthase [Clostridiales bacterium]
MRFDRALRVDIPQALRALGYGGTGPGAQVGAQLAQAALQIERQADAHWTFRPFVLEAPPRLPEAQLSLPGRDIALHLAGCGACLLLAVTLGGGIERHIRAAEACDMAAALLLDVAASTLVEQYADEAERLLRLQYRGQGAHLTGRFSPGYGDLPLALQGDLLRLLNAQRQIGLTVSAGGILLPRKSITALLGVADRPVSGRPAGCETCALRARCADRKEGRHCGDNIHL